MSPGEHVALVLLCGKYLSSDSRLCLQNLEPFLEKSGEALTPTHIYSGPDLLRHLITEFHNMQILNSNSGNSVF